jgi:methylenetetrahydrofolate reductase (NADPH)
MNEPLTHLGTLPPKKAPSHYFVFPERKTTTMTDSVNDRKIVDLIQARGDEPWVSIEFFPPKTDAGVRSLMNAVNTLNSFNPVFADFTWGAGGSTSDLTVDLCIRTKMDVGAIPNMHLTCTNMESEKIDGALDKLKSAGITNVFALRGDPPAGQEVWTATDKGLTCALDLIKYIRQIHGDYFCLGCAGYPEGHPNKMTHVQSIDELTPSELARCSIEHKEDGTQEILVCKDADFELELEYLKKKVDAGADYIITQMFFDVQVFVNFVTACRAKGINVPILPGIMCISTYGGFKRMTGFCKTRVPAELAAEMEAVKADEVAVKELGFRFGLTMCRNLVASGCRGLHFYTLNTSALTVRILTELGMPRTVKESESAPVTVFQVNSPTMVQNAQG